MGKGNGGKDSSILAFLAMCPNSNYTQSFIKQLSPHLQKLGEALAGTCTTKDKSINETVKSYRKWVKTMKSNKSYTWFCTGRDSHYGCWDADFMGRCTSQGRKPMTKEEAEIAGQRHADKCYFKNAKFQLLKWKDR